MRRLGPWIPAGRRRAGGDRRPTRCTGSRGRRAGSCPAGSALPAGHLQGVDDELGADVIGDGPAHDAPAVGVDHCAAVDPPVAGAVLGDVGEPHPVGGVGGEDATHQVLVRRRCRPVAALTGVAHPPQGCLAHQAGDAFAPARDPEPEAQLGMYPWSAVGAAGVGMDAFDRGGQLGIRNSPGRQGPGLGFVVAGAGDAQHLAGHRDGVPVLGQLTDQRGAHFGGSTFSCAK